MSNDPFKHSRQAQESARRAQQQHQDFARRAQQNHQDFVRRSQEQNKQFQDRVRQQQEQRRLQEQHHHFQQQTWDQQRRKNAENQYAQQHYYQQPTQNQAPWSSTQPYTYYAAPKTSCVTRLVSAVFVLVVLAIIAIGIVWFLDASGILMNVF